MKSISVIIPVYNRKELLKRAVTSVLKQRYTDYELILIDDCSDDSPFEEIASLSPQIITKRLEFHCGVSAARNAGILHSRGRYLAFLDSDDEWLPKKLERQIEWFAANPQSRIVQTREIWIRDGKRVNAPKTHEKTGGDIFYQSLDRCMITPSSVLMERSLFDEVGGFNEALPACEDYDLWLKITHKYPVGLIDENLLIRYGGHSDQLSATTPMLDRFRLRSMLDLVSTAQLSPQQKSAACGLIAKKAQIMAHGFLKRGNTDQYEHYDYLARQYQPMC